jgi:hypothetical protein
MRLRLVLFIASASAIDALLTHIGIKLGIIQEANPLMDWLYERSETFFFLLKVSFPIMLLLILPQRISKPIRGLLLAACGVYLFVLSLHGVWLIQLLRPL